MVTMVGRTEVLERLPEAICQRRSISWQPPYWGYRVFDKPKGHILATAWSAREAWRRAAISLIEDEKMKMREFVDAAEGEGSWDQMHDTGIFETVPVEVGGTIVQIFPGTDREVTVEKVQAEVRKALAEITSANSEGAGNFNG